MPGLRWYRVIHIGSINGIRFSHTTFVDLDGEVRTTKFTKLAPYAEIRVCSINFAIPEREDLLGTKGDTNIAAFAPALPNNVFEESLLFAHSPTLLVLSVMSAPVPALTIPFSQKNETGIENYGSCCSAYPMKAGMSKC
jgi:hypothetical protein